MSNYDWMVQAIGQYESRSLRPARRMPICVTPSAGSLPSVCAGTDPKTAGPYGTFRTGRRYARPLGMTESLDRDSRGSRIARSAAEETRPPLPLPADAPIPAGPCRLKSERLRRSSAVSDMRRGLQFRGAHGIMKRPQLGPAVFAMLGPMVGELKRRALAVRRPGEDVQHSAARLRISRTRLLGMAIRMGNRRAVGRWE